MPFLLIILLIIYKLNFLIISLEDSFGFDDPPYSIDVVTIMNNFLAPLFH